MGAAIYFASSPNRNYFLASITVLVVGLVDSFDGMVAVRTSKTSSWGAFLDGIVDRLIDFGIGI
jgi:phosphatidylglycerophosphate synthase